MTVRAATSDADFAIARALISEYVEWLAEDFCAIGFEQELRTLPSMYGPPAGKMLLAFEEDEPVGCIAYRGYAEGECEMKRLYVVPRFRGSGLGRRLVVELIDAAREQGCTRMRLDTLPKLAAAIALYRRLGFTEIEPYYDNPIPGVTFMALDLSTWPQRLDV